MADGHGTVSRSASTETRRKAAVLLGPPGCGKTTVADRLATRASVQVLETGRLLRRAVEENAPSAETIKGHLESGDLVPTEIVTNVLVRELPDLDARLVIFDGYPRSPDQVEYFFRMIEAAGLTLAAIVVLELSPGEARERLRLRGRSDDVGTIEEDRFESYERETLPLIEQLERRSGLVFRVQASVDVDTVVARTEEVLRETGIDL